MTQSLTHAVAQGASKGRMTGLSLRGSVYSLVKRVPREYAHLETRAVVRRSLKTGDAREARKRAIRELAAMLARWESGVASESEYRGRMRWRV